MRIVYDPNLNPFGAKSINFSIDEFAFKPGLNTVDDAVADNAAFKLMIDSKAFVIPKSSQVIPEPVRAKKKVESLIEIPVPTE